MTATSTTAPDHRLLERTAYLEVCLVAFLWGVNWPLLKLIMPHVAPLTLLVVRFIGAAAVAAIVSAVYRRPIAPLKGERLPLFAIGLCQVAFPMALGIVGLQYLGAGRATVLVYTMQLWALPLGWLILKERVTAMRLAGGLIGFAGIVLFLNPLLVNWSDPRVLAGNLMVGFSAILWAFGSCLYRIRRWQSSQWSQVMWQFLWGAVTITLVGWLIGSPNRIEWTGLVTGIIIFNCLISITAAYWLFNRARAVLPASKVGQVVSAVPVLSVLISALFLGEQITVLAVISMALILGGIYVTLRSR